MGIGNEIDKFVYEVPLTAYNRTDLETAVGKALEAAVKGTIDPFVSEAATRMRYHRREAEAYRKLIGSAIVEQATLHQASESETDPRDSR